MVELPGENRDSIDESDLSPDGEHLAIINELEPETCDGRLYLASCPAKATLGRL